MVVKITMLVYMTYCLLVFVGVYWCLISVNFIRYAAYCTTRVWIQIVCERIYRK